MDTQQLRLFQNKETGAQFSECRTWRYALRRTWDAEKSHVMFVGLNPSTADETKNDPTVRRCMGYAKRWGYGGIYMLNIFAFRATNPRALKKCPDPVGPENYRFLQMYHDVAGMTVACWGAHGAFKRQGEFVATMLDDLYCLDVTLEGHPKHPLYLRADLVPKRYVQGME